MQLCVQTAGSLHMLAAQLLTILADTNVFHTVTDDGKSPLNSNQLPQAPSRTQAAGRWT